MIEVRGMALMADSWMVTQVVVVVAGAGTVLTDHPRSLQFLGISGIHLEVTEQACPSV